MSLVVGSDLLIITIVCGTISEDTNIGAYPHCCKICYNLIESRQSASLEDSNVPRFLYRHGHPALLEEPASRLVSALRTVTTKEALIEHFQSALSYVVSTPLIKSSSFLGTFVRSLAVAAKNIPFSYWTVLYNTWQIYSSFIIDRTEGNEVKDDMRVQAMEEASDGRQSTFQSPQPRQHNEPQMTLMYNKAISSWRSGEFTTAVSRFHRHYDYLGTHLDLSCHQYALLDLALLQADFGHHKEALLAIYEAIDAARDNHDQSCLEFALTWLRDIEQHKRTTNKVYPDHMPSGSDCEISTSHQLQEFNLNNLHSTKTDLNAAGGLSALLRGRSSTKDGSTSDLFAAYLTWSALDVAQLARLSLRLVRLESLAAEDTEASIRVRCAISQALFTEGKRAEARQLLDSADDCVLSNNKLHRIWLTQHAFFRLQESSCSEADLLLELQEIERDPMTIGARVRRQIKQGLLTQAEDILHKYLQPFTIVDTSQERCQRKILLLQLTSEIYIKSSEPERAFITTVHALKLAHAAHLYKAYRELMESLDFIANVLEK